MTALADAERDRVARELDAVGDVDGWYFEHAWPGLAAYTKGATTMLVSADDERISVEAWTTADDDVEDLAGETRYSGRLTGEKVADAVRKRLEAAGRRPRRR